MTPSRRSDARPSDGAPDPADAIRAYTRRRFIWRNGVVRFALPVALFSMLGVQALRWTGLLRQETVLDFLVWLGRQHLLWGVAGVAVYAALWTVGGLVMGRYLWNRTQRRLRRDG